MKNISKFISKKIRLKIYATLGDFYKSSHLPWKTFTELEHFISLKLHPDVENIYNNIRQNLNKWKN